jgi:hypothetical protein
MTSLPAATGRPTAPLPLGARIGTFIGLTAWTLAIAVACLAHGDVDGALNVAAPCLLLSVALWQLLTFGQLAALRAFGADAAAAQRAFLGMLLIAMGLLLWIVDRWALPYLSADPGVLRTLNRLGSALSVPTPLLWGVPIAGIALLHGPLRALLRGAGAAPGSR